MLKVGLIQQRNELKSYISSEQFAAPIQVAFAAVLRDVNDLIVKINGIIQA